MKTVMFYIITEIIQSCFTEYTIIQMLFLFYRIRRMKDRSKTESQTKPLKALHLPFIVPIGITQGVPDFVS